MLAGWEPSEIFGYLRQIQLASVITYIHTRQGEQGEQNAGFTRRTISGSKIFLLTLRSLYVISVRCRLEYASEIWSPKLDAMI